METPYIMHSSLRDINPSSSVQRGGNTYQILYSYTNATGTAFETGTSLPIFQHGHAFPVFVGTGIYLVVVHFRLIDAALRPLHAGVEPQQINKLKAVLMGSDGTDVTRDGLPYGTWPAEIIYECEDHVHTVPGSPSFQGIAGVSTGSGFGGGITTMVGNSRRWQEDQQAFFIVDARRGDRLFVYRDYLPYTELSYEIIRLAPALMRFGAIEI
jgi:hypothetical protein